MLMKDAKNSILNVIYNMVFIFNFDELICKNCNYGKVNIIDHTIINNKKYTHNSYETCPVCKGKYDNNPIIIVKGLLKDFIKLDEYNTTISLGFHNSYTDSINFVTSFELAVDYIYKDDRIHVIHKNFFVSNDGLTDLYTNRNILYLDIKDLNSKRNLLSTKLYSKTKINIINEFLDKLLK